MGVPELRQCSLPGSQARLLLLLKVSSADIDCWLLACWVSAALGAGVAWAQAVIPSARMDRHRSHTNLMRSPPYSPDARTPRVAQVFWRPRVVLALIINKNRTMSISREREREGGGGNAYYVMRK